MQCFGLTIRQNKLHSRESNAEAKILPRHFIFIRLYMLKIVVMSCAQVLTRVVRRYNIAVAEGDKSMRSELVPGVSAVAEFMPPRKNGIFEKSMEVARLLLEHEPISIIAHTVDGAIQTYGMMKETKYRTKAVKYVAHLDEVRINAQVEMARIQNSNMAVMMYIDRNFQQSLDRMQDSYLSQTYMIEQSSRRMIQEVNSQVESHLANIDKRYKETVRENELNVGLSNMLDSEL